VSLVSRACGLSRKAIGKGILEIKARTTWKGRIRRPGAGRKPIRISDPQLVDKLEAMVDETTRGDPESPLRWTCKSSRTLAEALNRRKHPISHTKVAQLLHDLDYSLQSNRKTEEGGDHPDRDAQFRHINNAAKSHLAGGWPVISVDTKKKELIGNYHNSGQQWRSKEQPYQVLGHDFPSPDVPRAYPYGIYDRAQHRVRQYRDRSRHRCVCRGFNSRLVAARRKTPLSQGQRVTDYSRWRWKQWVAVALVEGRAAEVRR
jgi:hypothetical protein